MSKQDFTGLRTRSYSKKYLLHLLRSTPFCYFMVKTRAFHDLRENLLITTCPGSFRSARASQTRKRRPHQNDSNRRLMPTGDLTGRSRSTSDSADRGRAISALFLIMLL